MLLIIVALASSMALESSWAQKNGLFIIDLKSDKVEMVCEGKIMHGVVPYTSFYIPGTILLGL